MIVSAETFLKGCKAVLESQLFATFVGIVFGSYFIEKLHVGREAERETLRWLITQINQYADIAVLFWNARLHKNDPGNLDVLRAKLRSEFPFLKRATDNIKCINKDNTRIHDTTYAIMDLYFAATDGGFDSDEVTEEESLQHILRCEDAAVKVKQFLYSYLTEWNVFSLAGILPRFLCRHKN